jgi:hypothetical protein
MATQIFVRKYWNGITFTIDCDIYDSIDNIKDKIELTIGLPVEDQILSFEDIELSTGRTLADYGIMNESTIYLYKREPEPEPWSVPLWLIGLLVILVLISALMIFKLG